MLKGHLQIDLHNEITGENERVEQDNLVTNTRHILEKKHRCSTLRLTIPPVTIGRLWMVMTGTCMRFTSMV